MNKLTAGLLLVALCVSFSANSARPSFNALQTQVNQLEAQVNQLQAQVNNNQYAAVLDANNNQVGVLIDWVAGSTAYVMIEKQGAFAVASVGERGFHHLGSLSYTQPDCQGTPLIAYPSGDMNSFARLREDILYIASNTPVAGGTLIFSHWRVGASSFDGMCENFVAPFTANDDYKTLATTMDISIFTPPFRYSISQ